MIKSIVFVRCFDKERSSVFNVPSTIRYLFHCKKPAIINDSEIKHLKKLELNNFIINKDLSIGDIIFLDKVNQSGLIEKNQNKTGLI